MKDAPPGPELDRFKEAVVLLQQLGLAKHHITKQAALALLVFAGVAPTEGGWAEARVRFLRIEEAMAEMRDVFPSIPKGKRDPREYAPNTRESVRKKGIKPLLSVGVLREQDPSLPTNDQNSRYGLTEPILPVLKSFGKPQTFESTLAHFRNIAPQLVDELEAQRLTHRVCLEIEGKKVTLSPGEHSRLIGEVVSSFAPRFVPGAKVLYMGDTGRKWDADTDEKLSGLGVSLNPHGKMPDVLLHDVERDWLVIVEAVTSEGPMSEERVDELRVLFDGARPGIVYVTAIPDRLTLRKFAPRLAWDTEVWVAEEPEHLIHFNGDRFLGPRD
ncbi:hypothetical protein OG423_08580 [Micromonospora zamorensis]|uniref:BsuBI/PstI family type II restriction endonuclease n=1 Tax=Micromonospora zamorensis TaxID=709883 RepID=UPI00352B8AF0|nr:hypothetical protein OG423_08580 [Micromonospora zamorensis]